MEEKKAIFLIGGTVFMCYGILVGLPLLFPSTKHWIIKLLHLPGDVYSGKEPKQQIPRYWGVLMLVSAAFMVGALFIRIAIVDIH